MNKKGYTLVEVLVSIMILSIAGTMLVSSFGTVIYYMSRAQSVKTSSDDMYAYIEKKDDSLGDTYEVDSNPIQYSIKSNKKTIEVSGNYQALTSTLRSDIGLKSIDSEVKKLLMYDETFNDFMNFNDDLYKKINTTTLSMKINDKTETVCELSKCTDEKYYFDFLNTVNGKDNLPEFISDFLPVGIKEKYYIRISYPWKVNKDKSIDPLIYLTTASRNDGAMFDQEVKFVYDYKLKNWYYYSGSNTYEMPNGGTHILRSATDVFETDLIFNRVQTINTWDEFITQIKQTNSGWKILNKRAVVGDKDNYWKPV